MKAGKLYPIAEYEGKATNGSRYVRTTGEFRPPRKGEWFVSGAIVEGYLAVSDMSKPQHIAIPA